MGQILPDWLVLVPLPDQMLLLAGTTQKSFTSTHSHSVELEKSFSRLQNSSKKLQKIRPDSELRKETNQGQDVAILEIHEEL